MKRFFVYVCRWQLSTPVLALCTGGLTIISIKNSLVANFLGACIFFWIDKKIFTFKRR